MSAPRDRRKLPVGLPDALREIEADVPEGEPAPWGPDSRLSVVGGRVPRVEGAEKASGAARYTSDVRLPGMLFGKVLRSPHPHARVRRVDLAPAKALPGVKAAIALAEGREVGYEGDEIAAVAAVTEEAAEDALRAIRVEYEILPFVTDLESARAPDAPAAADGPNERPGRPGGRGNVEEALASADAVIVATYRTPVQTHVPLETHGSVAQWEGDRLTVWDSTQAVHRVRDSLAQRLRKDKNSVRAICEHVGGGFGSKLGLGPSAVIAAMLAREAGAPVKVLLSRREEHLASGNRPSSVQTLRIGARKEGPLVALSLKSYGTGGVRAGAAGCSGPARGIYACPNWRVEEGDVVTNSGPACAMRAPGFVQGAFALESAMDEMAGKLGLDPLEFRRKNLRPDSALDEIRAREYGIGAEKIGWSRRTKDGSGTGVLRRGLGMANGIWGGSGGPGPVVEVTVSKDGTAGVAVGTQDIGTGTRTACAIVAAEELGLPLAAVRVRIGDTDLPFATGSGGSSTAPSVTPAVRVAAAQARASLLEAAAKILESPLAALEIAEGRVRVKGTDKSVGLFEAAGRHPSGAVTGRAQRSGNYRSFSGQTAGVQFAEVEVDTETGTVRVVKVVAVHDCGRIVNRLAAESQVIGGVVMGLSYALMEERIMDHRTGLWVNPDLENYKVLGCLECPEIEPVMLEVWNAGNSTGVMGLGEPPVVPTAGAVANAVANAIGVRVRELPITPARVLEALGRV